MCDSKEGEREKQAVAREKRGCRWCASVPCCSLSLVVVPVGLPRLVRSHRAVPIRFVRSILGSLCEWC